MPCFPYPDYAIVDMNSFPIQTLSNRSTINNGLHPLLDRPNPHSQTNHKTFSYLGSKLTVESENCLSGIGSSFSTTLAAPEALELSVAMVFCIRLKRQLRITVTTPPAIPLILLKIEDRKKKKKLIRALVSRYLYIYRLHSRKFSQDPTVGSIECQLY